MRGFRFLAFRADPEIGAAIEAAARADGVSLSGWLREAARRRLPDTGSLPALPPSPPRRRVAIPDTDVAAVARLVGEVGKLTGATVQLAKTLRETGRVLEHQSAESILRDFRATQTSLVQIVDRLRAAGAIS